MRRRELIGAGAAVLATAPFVAQAQEQKPLVWGSASLGSTGYVIIEGLATTVSKHSKWRGSSQSTQGGAENMALIGQGALDLGQTTSTDWQAALKGESPYKQPVKAHQMFSYALWTLSPIVLASSPIQSFEDLAGKRLAPGPAGGSTAIAYRTLLEQAGLKDKVRLQFGSWRECFEAVKNGSVDSTVSIAYSGKPASVVNELESAHKIRVIEVPRAPIEKSSQVNPGILLGETNPALWKATGEKPLTAPAFSGVLAAHPRVTAEMGYDIAKAVYEHADEIRRIAAELQEIRLDFATKYLLKGVPVNAGAARYFKEKGVWRDELTIAS
jgi:uncharacterized protein